MTTSRKQMTNRRCFAVLVIEMKLLIQLKLIKHWRGRVLVMPIFYSEVTKGFFSIDHPSNKYPQ